MRVCLVCQEYPPDTVGGGIGTYTANLARGLAAAEHRVSVVARAVTGLPGTTDDSGVRVHRILPPRIRGNGKTFADAYFHARGVAATVDRLVATEGVDIVQSPEHGAEGLLVALGDTDLPHVVRFHTPLYLVHQAVGHHLTLGARIVDLMEGISARRAVLNTSASRALAERVATRFRIPRNRVRVIPNFIDHETFRPAATHPAGPPTVLFVGKVAPLKGILVLAQAVPAILRRIPSARIIIVGSDHPMPDGRSTRATVAATLEQAGVGSAVSFVDLVDRPQLVRLYQHASVYVFPTLWDNFPNTCLEAMACGLPAVASSVGGLPEIIDDGRDGVLVAPGNAERLAEAVTGLLADPDRRIELGRKARQKVEMLFTRDRIITLTVGAYEEAIALKRNGAVLH